jgi:uncharacterized repeat protein (TIGR03803 family)
MNKPQNRYRTFAVRARKAIGALASAILMLPFVATRSARAQTYTVLYSFTGGADGGGGVFAGLVRDGAGNLYGTTWGGGANHLGTVFKLDTTGKETVLYSFAGGSDGDNPHAGLVRDSAGNLYGTTVYGGTNGCSSGCGIVFKLDKTNKKTLLHEFTGASDGEYPYAGLIRDSAGNLYGTTYAGGASGFGTVFKVDTTGKETILHSFTGGAADGEYPFAGLVRDAAGNLYGTTQNGGAFNYGTVFKLDATNKETLLYSFSGGVDGGYPYYGYLVRDSAGNLYGTTFEGGAFNYGVVFKLDKTGKETVLYSFAGGTKDGEYPYGGVVRDPSGSLYGTTYLGGAFSEGTVFKVGTTGKETLLRSLAYSTDGGYPYDGLVRDSAGNLYGTTDAGGPAGAGTVFKLVP